MAITVQITFEYSKPAGGVPVTWIIRNRDNATVLKGTTNTSSGGVLTIPDIPIGDSEQLKLSYEVLGKAKLLYIKHTMETRSGSPLKSIHKLDKKVFIKFMDYNDGVDDTLKNVPVEWEHIQKSASTGKVKNTTNTDPNGTLMLEDVEVRYLDENLDVQSFNQTITYTIRGITKSIEITSASFEQLQEFKVNEYLSTRVEIKHIGGSIRENDAINWKLHKIKHLPPQPNVKRQPRGNTLTAPELGDEVKAGTTALTKIDKGLFLVFPKFEINKDKPLALAYEVDGKAQAFKIEAKGPTLISETVFLGTTIQIDFKSCCRPTNNKPVTWTLKNSKSEAVKVKEPLPAATDGKGRLTFEEVIFTLEETLTFTYQILDKSGTIEIKHNDDSESGLPLSIIELLDGTNIEIEFISRLGTAKKPLSWTLKDKGSSEIALTEPKPLETDESGKLTIQKLNIPAEEALSFEYKILEKSGIVAVKHTAETKKGETLLIKQYLDGIPIHLDFVNLLKLDSEKKPSPLPGEAVELTIKDTFRTDTEYQTTEPKPTATDEKGRASLKYFDITDKSLNIEYKIRGREGSVTVERSDDRSEITKIIPISGGKFKFKNPNRFWLTYETRFNWTTFSKTNQSLKMCLYRTEVNNLLVMIAPKSDLEDAELQALKDIFFPDLESLEQLRDFGIVPWEGQRKKFKESPQINLGSRDEIKLHTGYAVLPYNLRDNDEDSQAIGTNNKSRVHKYNLKALKETLDMWNTASRSSIVEVRAKGGKFTEDLFEKNPPDDRPFLWNKADFGKRDGDFLEPNGSGTTELNLTTKGATLHNNLFSLKTGVNIIGYHKQGNLVGKDKLEHNSILAALRSAYIRWIERKRGYDSFNDPHLLVLTEIMTVTEIDPNWDLWMFPPEEKARTRETQPNFGDGYQIRSLRGMKHNKEYFPPISIPFVKVKEGKIDPESIYEMDYKRTIKSELLSAFKHEELPRSYSVFEQIDNEDWKRFWNDHYAVPLAHTKARLLLRYGLQVFGGNAQNYLLEMENGVPNGRVVVRDMGDYALHDFVLWALFGPRDGTVPDPRLKAVGEQEGFVNQWKEAFKDEPLLKFECDVLHQFMDDTGKTSEFPTFTGYHRSAPSGMSTFNPFCDNCNNSGAAKFVGHISPLWSYAMPVSPQVFNDHQTNVSKEQWAKVFKAETEWGISHARAWVHFLEVALKHEFHLFEGKQKPITEFLKINGWKSTKEVTGLADCIYHPDAYLEALKTDNFPSGWSDLYTKFKTWEMYLGWQIENFLITEEGQKAIRAYWGRGCKLDESEHVFRVRLLDGKREPLRHAHTKFLRANARSWDEYTDNSGCITIYGKPEDYQIQIMKYRDLEGSWFQVADIKNLKNEPGVMDLGYIKVEVVGG